MMKGNTQPTWIAWLCSSLVFDVFDPADLNSADVRFSEDIFFLSKKHVFFLHCLCCSLILVNQVAAAFTKVAQSMRESQLDHVTRKQVVPFFLCDHLLWFRAIFTNRAVEVQFLGFLFKFAAPMIFLTAQKQKTQMVCC